MVVGEEVLEYLIDGALLAYDEPHGATQVNVVLLVLIGLPLCLCLPIDLLYGAGATGVWALAEVCLIEEGLVVGPEASILVLHEKAQHDLVLPLQLQIIIDHWSTGDLDPIACHKEV